MATQLASARRAARRRRSARVVAVSALGPLTAVAGVVWALAQPYRVVLLEPAKHGFWDMLVQPPLLVLLVGALFHFVVAPGVVEDLENEDDR